ncbi:MAG TPA: hypothetical protein VM940_10305 [Chthoniobacterales bacterium]|jgi:hypothetical protein|nr:hypothetical protein [Chthoniobacterales bacterium]
MVWDRPALADELDAIRNSNMAIEQSVAVYVTAFFSIEEETDASEPVHSRPNAWPVRDRGFDFANCANAFGTEKRGNAQEHCVENVRQTWNPPQPFQSADCKLENLAV